MIIVTGGSGLIGSNIIKQLNQKGEDKIILVDDLENGTKVHNISDLNIYDYWDKQDLIHNLNELNHKIEGIFHLGANSKTTEWDGKHLMKNNYEYSKDLLNWCIDNNILFVYASSASVYGTRDSNFKESREFESPLNMYAYSKFQFDQYARNKIAQGNNKIIGLRYFNVFGPRESHKGFMASTIFHFYNQLKESGSLRLFEGTNGIENGEQMRDFVFVEDCAKVNLWFLENQDNAGIFNVGTGVPRTFNDIANSIIRYFGHGSIEYIPFPEKLKGVYQNYTCADLEALRNIGYYEKFLTLEEGITKYLDWLELKSSC